MGKYKYIKIVTDAEAFNDRVDELTSTTSYDFVKHTVADLKRALYDNPDIAGLCAPQIGVNLRLFVVKTAKTEAQRFKVFLNPITVSSEGLHLSREISASFPRKQFIIPRSNKVHVAYQEEDGKINSETYVGAYGEIVQQMIQMLDGITLLDNGLDLDDIGGPDVFDKASKKDQQAVIAIYLKQLQATQKDLAKEIEDTPELKQVDDTINFMQGMLTGDITPIKKEEKPLDNKLEDNSDSKE